jgi:anthranilate phosphoribosyltransferase
MSGEVDKIQTAAFLASLRMKGETEEEIAAFARVMRDLALKISPNVEKSVDLALPPRRIEECIEKIGIGFMFAPLHHQAMKNVMEVRQKLGMRTVFNILGPLTNPANATHQLIGVYDASVTEKIAKVLRILGLKKALVVHGEPGVDEVSVCGKTKVSQLSNGEIRTYFINPEDFGVERALPEKIAGGSRKESARILRDVLSCKEEGAKRDVVLLNAAAAIFAANEAKSIGEGFEIARDVLEDGRAAEKLEGFIRFAK